MQKEPIHKSLITKTLDWAYSKALGGATGVESAYELGNSYMKQGGTLEKQVDSLIKWQVTKAAASGFVAGLGGFSTMILTIPANIVSVVYIQVRMVAAIAYMGGYDLNNDKVKSLIYISMVGNGAKELLKDLGVKAGEKLIMNIVEKVSSKMAAKIGEKSISTMSKAVPVAGGIISGAFDATSTRVIGKVAKKIFINGDNSIFLRKDRIIDYSEL